MHRQVLLGRYHADKATEEGLAEGGSVLRDRDRQGSGQRHGPCRSGRSIDGTVRLLRAPASSVMPKAKHAAEAAIALDESLADAHAALGFIHLVYDWDGPAAEHALLRALELNPTLATARLNYAAYLTTQARHDEAVDRNPARGRVRSRVDSHQRVRHEPAAVRPALRRGDRARASVASSSNRMRRSPSPFRDRVCGARPVRGGRRHTCGRPRSSTQPDHSSRCRHTCLPSPASRRQRLRTDPQGSRRRRKDIATSAPTKSAPHM